MLRFQTLNLALLRILAGSLESGAADWARFRGPGGNATSSDTGIAAEWSETKNLRWKVALPGRGSSSPVVVGDRVYVTCYSGYGLDRAEPGSLEDLRRHLICLNRADGSVIWDTPVAAEMPEDPYQGFITEHGYASSTPVVSGDRIHVFFGKTGALSFDMNGKPVWQVDMGEESSSRRWGSASSPLVYKDTVIINASEESQSIRALKADTGDEVWKSEASAIGSTVSLVRREPLCSPPVQS